ncbi:type II secretion system minor pseudopilin GspK [Candidatus Omnitrophota bacterium]
MRYRKSDKSGIILIIVIWILTILTMFAMSIARMSRLEVALTRYRQDKLKATYIAEAGLASVLRRIQEDGFNQRTRDYDTLYECGIAVNDDATPEELLKEIAVGEGYYSVRYELPGSLDEEEGVVYGIQDEERKINLNAISVQNYFVFKQLLELFEVEEEEAKGIAASVVDWLDSNEDITNPPYGAEDEYYMGQDVSYHCKNSSFESVEELLFVKGVTEEIFSKIKHYVTIYPMEAQRPKVNVNTADATVLQVLANASIRHVPSTNQVDAESLVDKIMYYRLGDDGIEATEDDRNVPLLNGEELLLNQKEQSLFVYVKTMYFLSKSDYFRIIIEGTSKDGKISSGLETVVNRIDLVPLLWQED